MPQTFTKIINILGNSSEYSIGVENDESRVSHNWNSSGQSRYLKSEEPALNLNLGVVTDPYFKIKYADEGIAGDNISWNEHFVIKKNGNVGIGNINPNSKLHVNGPIISDNSNTLKGRSDYLTQLQDGTGRVNNYWNSTKNPNKYLISNEPAFNLNFGIVTDPYFKIKYAPRGIKGQSINWNSHLVIKQNGNIGIGKSYPDCKLDVDGEVTSSNFNKIKGIESDYLITLQEENSRIQHYWNSTASINKYIKSNEPAFNLDIGIISDPYFKIKYAEKGIIGQDINWSEHLVIKQNGNIGIGNTNPSYRLDILGDINFTGNITSNGSSINFNSLQGSVTNSQLAGSIDLTSKVTNNLPVANGGTGSDNASDARAALGVDVAGTDNSTDVTLANTNYLSINGQELTGGTVPIVSGGTGSTTALGARTLLGVDAAGTDNSTNVTLSNTNYLSISGQEITGGTVPIISGGTGSTNASDARTALGVDAAGTDNSTDVTLANTNYLSISGQELTGGVVPVTSGGTGSTTAEEARAALGVIDVTLANTDYLSISGQEITGRIIPITSGGTGANSAASARSRLGVDAAGTDNSTDVTLANTNYLSLSGQELTGGTVPIISGGTGATTAQDARTSLGVPSTFNDLSGEIKINDSTKIFYSEITVTVSGGKYYIDGTQQQIVNLQKGLTYRFNLEDSTISGHPFKLSTTSDGSHNSGSEYSTNVTSQGTPGESGSYLQIVIEQDTPLLYYYCSNHSGMGGRIFTGEELNFLDITTLGTSESSKAVTADTNGNIIIADGTNDFDIASHDGTNGLKLGSILVTSTAAEINKLDATNTVPNPNPWASVSRWARISYNFNSNGGLQGTINLTGTIPNNAIIIGGFVDIITSFSSSSNSASCSLSLESTDDLVASIAINNGSSPWSIGIKSIVPNGTGGNAIKLSSDNTVDLAISSEDLTAGTFDLWLEYLIGS